MRWFRARCKMSAAEAEEAQDAAEKEGVKGSLKLQSPSSRRHPGLNHLRSSLISGIDWHARDLVPPSPPSSPPLSSSSGFNISRVSI